MTLLHVHVCGLFCCPNHLCPARWLDASHYRQYNATECPFRHQTVTAPVSGPAKDRSWLDERQPALPGGPDQPRQRAVRPLPDLLDALVNDRGRVAAAEALGVNYRTMMNCYDSPRVSRRMRQVLADFRDAQVFADGSAGVGNGDGGAENQGEPLKQRLAELEEEGRGLREIIEAQARHWRSWGAG